MLYKETIKTLKEAKTPDLSSVKSAYYDSSGMFSIISALEELSDEDLASSKIDKSKELKIWKQILKLEKQSELAKYL